MDDLKELRKELKKIMENWRRGRRFN